MEISNDDLARILGRIEARQEEQGRSSLRQETALTNLDNKLAQRLDGHEKRIQSLEAGAVKTGAIAGIVSGLGMTVVAEIVKSKLGL